MWLFEVNISVTETDDFGEIIQKELLWRPIPTSTHPHFKKSRISHWSLLFLGARWMHLYMTLWYPGHSTLAMGDDTKKVKRLPFFVSKLWPPLNKIPIFCIKIGLLVDLPSMWQDYCSHACKSRCRYVIMVTKWWYLLNTLVMYSAIDKECSCMRLYFIQ